ncbi:MFS transporter [Pseudomonas sp. S 311-6]|nr:MFS transporter [Pseudomonas sp. S 311-6]
MSEKMRRVELRSGLFWRLALLALVYFIFVFCSLAVIGLLPVMAIDWAVPQESLAWLVTSFSVAFVVGAFANALWLQRCALRRVLVMGLFGLALGAFALAVATTPFWANVARGVQGFSAALMGPTASVYALLLSPIAFRGRALGMVFSGTTVAIVIGVPLAAWMGELLPWRTVFIGVAAAAALMMLIVPLALPSGQRSQNDHAGMFGLFQTMRQAEVTLALLSMLLRMAAQFACYTLIGKLVVDRFGWDPGKIPAVLLIYGVAGVLGNLIAGWWTDRYGQVPALRWSGVALSVGYAALILAPQEATDWLSWGVIGYWGIASVLFASPQQAFLASRPAPVVVAIALSMNAAALYAGMAVGSGLAGSIWMAFGLDVLLWVAFLLSVLAVAASEMSFRARRM